MKKRIAKVSPLPPEMAVVPLSECYNPEVYNELGDIDRVHNEVTEEQIFGLGQIILRHRHSHTVAVMIAHRHFALEHTQVLVEKAERMENNNNNMYTYLVRPIAIECARRIRIRPNIIFLANSDPSKWHPVNYTVEDVDTSAWEDEKFLTRAAEYLIRNRLVGKLMLGLRKVGINGHKYLELNYPNRLSSELRLVPNDELIQLRNVIRTTTYEFRMVYHDILDEEKEMATAAINFPGKKNNKEGKRLVPSMGYGSFCPAILGIHPITKGGPDRRISTRMQQEQQEKIAQTSNDWRESRWDRLLNISWKWPLRSKRARETMA